MKVMVAGHLCLDISPTFTTYGKYNLADIFSPGKLTTVGKATLSTGGPVSNTGLALAKLGVDVVLNGKIGADEFGRIIRNMIGEQRAGTLKIVEGESSSYTIVLAPPGIDRFVLHNPATNDTFGPEDINYELAQQCILFHFGYPPLMKRMYENEGSELAEIYKQVKNLGVTTSLDMAMPDPTAPSGQVDWIRILEKTLPHVDIFTPSLEEISFMVDRTLFEKRKDQTKGGDPVLAYKPEDCTSISTRLLSMGAKIIAIKCGIRGLYLRTAGGEQIAKVGSDRPKDVAVWADRELWASTFKADNFCSALGAGDATIAGFLCGFLRGFSPLDTLLIANTVGWQNVQAVDALSGIGDWPTTLQLLLDKNRIRNPLEIDYPGWIFSGNEQIFSGPYDRK